MNIKPTSILPDSIVVPSGVTEIHLIESVCPLNVRLSLPVSISQSIRVQSEEPETTKEGLKGATATQVTEPS